RAKAAGEGLEDPDVDDGGGEVDVAHALATDAAVGHLHAATVTDDPLVFRAFVFAAGAFPVAFRAENALAEQAVFLGPVGAVIDGLGLLHFAEGPRTDVVRAGEVNLDRAVIV